MQTVRLENETEFLLITINNYLYPDSTDVYDGNWLATSLEFCIGAFKGKTKASLRIDEFSNFYKDLKNVFDKLKGSASFSSMESWLKLDVKVDNYGHFEISGKIQDKLGDANKLEFMMTSELSRLKKTLDGLDLLLEKYPARK